MFYTNIMNMMVKLGLGSVSLLNILLKNEVSVSKKNTDKNYNIGLLSVKGMRDIEVSYIEMNPDIELTAELYNTMSYYKSIIKMELEKMFSSKSMNPTLKDLYNNLKQINLTKSLENGACVSYSRKTISIDISKLSSFKGIIKLLERALCHMYIEQNTLYDTSFNHKSIYFKILSAITSHSVMYSHLSYKCDEKQLKNYISKDIIEKEISGVIDYIKEIQKLRDININTVFPTNKELDFFKATVYKLSSLTVDYEYLDEIIYRIIKKLNEENITADNYKNIYNRCLGRMSR
ncbi:MAG: hypothetical protein JJV96_00480 [Alphaproteobacteria bacterium]|nr:hypothetical protein [Alphaproteobacteria bacterium]